MRYLRILAIFGCLGLIGCGSISQEVEEIEEIKEIEEFESGDSSPRTDYRREDSEESVESSASFSGADSLRLSYEQALDVRNVMTATLPEIPADLRGAIEGVLETFGNDIVTLGYFVDIVENEGLTAEEQTVVLELVADIENVMELFAQVVEAL